MLLDRFLTLSFAFLLVSYCECYKIFIYNPIFGHSHMKFMGKVAESLAEAGHDVVSQKLIVSIL